MSIRTLAKRIVDGPKASPRAYVAYLRSLGMQVAETIGLYDCWRRNSPGGKAGGVPPKEIFREIFWLSEPRTDGALSDPSFADVMKLRGTRELSVKRFEQAEPRFCSYEEFIQHLDRQF